MRPHLNPVSFHTSCLQEALGLVPDGGATYALARLIGIDVGALVVLLLVRAFGSVGRSLDCKRRNGATHRETQYLQWGIGCALLVHVVNWLGITYFDQTYVVWFMQLAAVSALSPGLQQKRRLYYRVVAS